MNISHAKRSYHPFILIAYYLNFLPEPILQNIPYSTRYEWKNKNINNLFGTAYFQENKQLFKALEAVAQHRKLQQTVKILIKIIALRRFITTYQGRLKGNFENI